MSRQIFAVKDYTFNTSDTYLNELNSKQLCFYCHWEPPSVWLHHWAILYLHKKAELTSVWCKILFYFILCFFFFSIFSILYSIFRSAFNQLLIHVVMTVQQHCNFLFFLSIFLNSKFCVLFCLFFRGGGFFFVFYAGFILMDPQSSHGWYSNYQSSNHQPDPPTQARGCHRLWHHHPWLSLYYL